MEPVQAGPSVQESQEAVSEQRLQSIEQRLEAMSQMLSDIRDRPAVSYNPSTAAQSTSTGHLQGTIETPMESSGHLANLGSGVRYVETSLWASLCLNAGELEDLLSSQARSYHSSQGDEISGLGGGHRADVQVAADEDAATAEQHMNLGGDIVQAPPAWSHVAKRNARTVSSSGLGYLEPLPSKDVCDRLVESFVIGYHPIVPLIHVATFKQRYEEFWAAVSTTSADVSVSRPFIALMTSILFAGFVSDPSAWTNDEQSAVSSTYDTADKLQKLALKALRVSNFPHIPTVESLAAYMMCQATWMREEEPLNCVAFVGLCLRVATMLGLHRDPNHFPDIGPVDGEVRRRVWWYLVHVDLCVALASGLPPLVDLDICDVRHVSEAMESSFALPATFNRDRGSIERDPSTLGILVAGKHQYSLALRRILASLRRPQDFMSGNIETAKHALEALDVSINDRVRRLPPVENFITFSFENNAPLEAFTRLLLSSLTDRAHCHIAHTLAKNNNGQGWSELYTNTIPRCQSLLIKNAQIVSNTDYHRVWWAWPGNHQPIHALTALLVYLYQAPNAPSAAENREVVDITFGLTDSHGGIVPGPNGGLSARPLTKGGGEVWETLRRLRARAWRRANLDPNFMYSREQALAACARILQNQSSTRSSAPQQFQEYTGEDYAGIWDIIGSPGAMNFGDLANLADLYDYNTPLDL